MREIYSSECLYWKKGLFKINDVLSSSVERKEGHIKCKVSKKKNQSKMNKIQNREK